MNFRILQHEKDTDHIRIGNVNKVRDEVSLEQIKQSVLNAYKERLGISVEKFSDYWHRVSLVDPDTFSTMIDVYNETSNL